MKAKTVYICTACGHKSGRWMGQCPSCSAWNTFEEREELPQAAASPRKGIAQKSVLRGPQPLKGISLLENDRILTHISELDRVLGGGIVKDSVSIIAAKPGAGKSTLLLQIAQNLAREGKRVLYVSGEESESQIRTRAERILPEIAESIFVHSGDNLNEVLSLITQIDPELIILDSIQTFYLEEYSSRPGSPTQITECTQAILRVAKDPDRKRAVIMAGQLTKEDELAGVRSLEHMVDTVLFMEADPIEEIRTLSTTKNRFGSTGEMGFFTMEEEGLLPITNPSKFFMTERAAGEEVNGCALAVIREGTRPMIVEIETLISQTYTPYPSRIAECMSRDHLGTLISILEQRGQIPLYDKNVVVKSTGGLKLTMPSVNLSVLLSLASSALRQPIPAGYVMIGDVGLTGELKKVPSMDMMVREVARLGFSHIMLPKGALKADTYHKLGSATLLEIRSLREAIRALFGDYQGKMLS